MERFIANHLYNMMTVFTVAGRYVFNKEAVVSEEDVKDDIELLDVTVHEIRHFGLFQSLKYAQRMRVDFSAGGYKKGDFAERVNVLRERVQDELEDVIFLFVPKDEVPYYQHKALFGEDVAAKFPLAAHDITEAGSCFASGRYTACVFHCMRVVEYGLRELAKSLKVTLPKKRHIDLEDWGALIGLIEHKIGTIEKMRRTHKREADLKFYHGAAAQFRHFKNAWRNHVMHTRASYERDEADIVLRHVREFMQFVSSKRTEK